METEEDQIAGGALSQLGGANLPASTSPSPLQELSTGDEELDAIMRMVYDEEPPPEQAAGSLEAEVIDAGFGKGTVPPPANQEGGKKSEETRGREVVLPPSPLAEYRQKLRGLRTQTKGYLDTAARAETEALGAEKKLHEQVKIIEDARTKRIEKEKGELQTAENLRQTAITDARTDITNATDMVLNSEVDPNRIYKSTGQKIGAALAMALGAAGSALTGTENGAMRVLQAAIDRDITAQRVEIEGLKFVVGQKQNAYSMLLAEHGDDRKVEEIMRAMGHQHIDNKIQALKTQYSLDANTSRLTAIEAKNKAEMTKTNERYVTLLFNGGMAEWSTNMSLLGRAGPGKTGDLGLSANLERQLSGSLVSKKMIEDLIKASPDTNPVGWDGSMMSDGAWYGNSAAFENKSDRLSTKIVASLSGADFTDIQLEELKKSMPKWGDFNDTKVRKLNDILTEVNQQIETIGSLVPLDMQKEFKTRFMPKDKSQQIKGID